MASDVDPHGRNMNDLCFVKSSLTYSVILKALSIDFFLNAETQSLMKHCMPQKIGLFVLCVFASLRTNLLILPKVSAYQKGWGKQKPLTSGDVNGFL